MDSTMKNSPILAAMAHKMETDLQCLDGPIISGEKSREMEFKIKLLPVELRILIFQQYLHPRGSDGKEAAALVCALRPDTEMYAEVLEVYFNVRTFRISQASRKSILNASRKVMGRITSLEIVYSMELGKRSWCWELTHYLPEYILQHFMNLTSIRLTTAATVRHPKLAQDLVDLVKTLILKSPTVKELTLLLPVKLANTDDTSVSTEPRHIFDPICQINAKTGINHEYVPTVQPKCVAIRWTATTETRSPLFHTSPRLTWTDHKYFRSIPWSNCNTLFSFFTLYHRVEFWYEENMTFRGLNPRRTMMICPVVDCVCMRLVARRCPIERKARNNIGWIGFRPLEPVDMSWDEEEKYMQIFRIPNELWWDAHD